MKKNILLLVVFAAFGTVSYAAALGLVDSAYIRSGTHADTPQDWSTTLALKNAGGDNCRIAMMKADLSSITGTVDAATFNFYSKDTDAHTIYVYGAKETATFEDWTGGATGNATWNSVTTGGLFTPQEDLYLASDPNLALLGIKALTGTGSDVLVSVSGSALVDLINNDADDVLTFVFAIDAGINSALRPHNHDSAPSLEFTYGESTPPAETNSFPYPLYGEAAQLYSNAAPYDLTQETYTFSTLWNTPAQDSINFLPQSYNSPIVTRGDSTFILYIDTDYRMKIAELTNGVFKAEAFIDNTLYQPDEFYANHDADPGNDVSSNGYYTVKFDDSHHSVSLGIDEDGYLHLVGDMHNYPRYEGPMAHLPLRYYGQNIMYWRSDNPLDISGFSFKGDQAGQCPAGFGFTYPFFFNDLNGKLHMTSRGHQADNNPIRCAPFSSYNAGTGAWSAIGGPDPADPGSAPRIFYDDGYEYDANGSQGKYSKTHPHGVFDRKNTMHLVAPLLSDPTLNPWGMGNNSHFVNTVLYAQSTNGTSFTKADGTAFTLPATVNLTANNADIAYSTTGYLAVMGNIAVDYQNNPYTVVKHKYPDDSPNDSFVIGWNGTTWTNYGELMNNVADFRLVNDPAGVMSYFGDSNGTMMRFWKPDGTTRTINLPWDMRVIDYEYLKKTGNFMGIAKVGGELTVVKMEISNRPGMSLIDPPQAPVSNHPPEITAPASASGNTLSVAATDADGDPLTFSWYKYYGPGDVTFSINGTTASSNTVATFSQNGTYELKVAVSDGTDTRISACMVTYDPADPNAPKITVEADAFPSAILLADTTTLSVTATNTPAGGTALYSWSKTSGPGTVTFSANGTASSSNTVASFDALGSYELQVEVSNSYGTVFSTCTVSVETTPPEPANGYMKLDFSSQLFGSFVGANDNFDRTGTVEVVESGAGVRFTGDLWKAFPIDYQMTPETVIEFDFSCPNEGELHAIAMTDTPNWDFTGSRYDLIKLHGTVNGLYINDRDGEYAGGTQRYVIAIGQLLNLNTEQKNYLDFVNADNKNEVNPNAQSTFSNVIIYEPNGDKDGDGQSNVGEVRLGTDPEDASSRFGITEGTALPATGKIRIKWPSQAGILYRVMESPDLAGWSVARDWAAAATPPEDALELNLTPSNGYFKIEAEIQ